VLTVGRDGFQWFGAGLGSDFGKKHEQFFLEFQTFCQGIVDF